MGRNARFFAGSALVLAVLLIHLSAPADDEKFVPPAPDRILSTLRPTHPRLLLDGAAIERVRNLIRANPHANRWYKAVKSEAAAILEQTPSEYRIPDGKRLLSVSRRVKDRVRTLAFVHLLEPDRRYVDRVWVELEAAAKFKDWNPSHFLDTAEMTHAFAVGYDWLYGEWSEEQRRTLREAIITLGLGPAIQVYEKKSGWHTNENNWNQVCNGGIGLGALALANEAPDLAAKVLAHAVASIPLAMAHYAPDGAGTEGVTYWGYGAAYNALFLSALESALGTDFGLSRIPGFAESGEYQIYMSGADRMAFNFADCGLSRSSTPQHFYLGRKYNRPLYSWYRFSALAAGDEESDILDLLWYDDAGAKFDPSSLPLDKHFREAECASMRSDWSPNALVVGLQAGNTNNFRGHRQLDLGSFILEAQGERWAIDSGVEHETYMEHRHHNPKWKYYRTRAEGHNTLVLNPDEGPDQEPSASAKITRFESAPNRTVAVIDLSQAYAKHARRVQRAVTMADRSYVTVTDEIAADNPADVWWFLHTEAAVKLNKDKTAALLSRNGKQLSVEIEGPRGAVFAVLDAAPFPTSPNPEKQASNKGRRKLAIHLAGVKDLTLSVKLTPVVGKAAPR